jgi:hypothetical protein
MMVLKEVGEGDVRPLLLTVFICKYYTPDTAFDYLWLSGCRDWRVAL